jgi:hypothetical protein
MNADFAELNAYVYYAAQGAVLDAVIWCLGPYVDDSRDYGWFRVLLALATRSALRPLCSDARSR